MNPREIIKELASPAYKLDTILQTFKTVFNENDEVKLFRLRATLVEELKQMIENLENHTEYEVSQAEIDTVDEICQGLSFHSLNGKMELILKYLTNAHVTTVSSLYQLNKITQDFSKVQQISELNEELKDLIKDEDLSETEQKILDSICESIDDAVLEHKVTGNKSIDKLFDILTGKFALYYNDIKNIKNKDIKDKLHAVYTATDKLNQVMSFVLSIGTKTEKFLNLFN